MTSQPYHPYIDEAEYENRNICYIEDRPKHNSRKLIRYKYNKHIDVIGEGGFGKVFKVTLDSTIQDVKSTKLYALKQIPTHLLLTEKERKLRALNEIRIHRQLKHKNICKFEHSFEDANNIYILLEYCPYQSLQELIKKRGKLKEYEVRYYMFQVLQALHYLRQHKIVHRDLTLSNIFLCDNNVVKIGDFGLSFKETENTEKPDLFCGTEGYVAPETSIYKFNYKTDVFAFGVCIYMLLAGKSLFQGTPAQTGEMIEKGDIPYDQHCKCSEEARDLLERIFQLENKRIDIDEIYKHPFFACGKGLIGVKLPKLKLEGIVDKEEITKLHQQYLDELNELSKNVTMRNVCSFGEVLYQKRKKEENSEDLFAIKNKGTLTLRGAMLLKKGSSRLLRFRKETSKEILMSGSNGGNSGVDRNLNVIAENKADHEDDSCSFAERDCKTPQLPVKKLFSGNSAFSNRNLFSHFSNMANTPTTTAHKRNSENNNDNIIDNDKQSIKNNSSTSVLFIPTTATSAPSSVNNRKSSNEFPMNNPIPFSLQAFLSKRNHELKSIETFQSTSPTSSPNAVLVHHKQQQQQSSTSPVNNSHINMTLNNNIKTYDTYEHDNNCYIIAFLDFSLHYGVAYVLNTGAVGMLFNDKTVMTQVYKDKQPCKSIIYQFIDHLHNKQVNQELVLPLIAPSDDVAKKAKVLFTLHKAFNYDVMFSNSSNNGCSSSSNSNTNIHLMKWKRNDNGEYVFVLNNKNVQVFIKKSSYNIIFSYTNNTKMIRYINNINNVNYQAEVIECKGNEQFWNVNYNEDNGDSEIGNNIKYAIDVINNL